MYSADVCEQAAIDINNNFSQGIANLFPIAGIKYKSSMFFENSKFTNSTHG